MKFFFSLPPMINMIPIYHKNNIVNEQYNEISRELDGSFNFSENGAFGETIETFAGHIKNKGSLIFFANSSIPKINLILPNKVKPPTPKGENFCFFKDIDVMN